MCVGGSSKTPALYGKMCLVSFIDDHTRLTWVYLLRDKTEVKEVFKTFHKMVQTQFQKNIKIITTDNGREYCNSVLGDFILAKGMIHQSSCFDTPQQNGVAERKSNQGPTLYQICS